jgi:3-hydroxyacyl-CoA dehydrogenase
MGQPEVNLGIIPGAEGTQRLPRLVGVAKAIEMCVTGKPIKADDGLGSGLIDKVIEGDLIAGAVAFARDAAAKGGAHPRSRVRVDRLPADELLPPLLTAGRDLAKKTRRNMEAPLAVVDAIGGAVTLPFDEGCPSSRKR